MAEPPGPWTADNALAESASRPSEGSDKIRWVQAEQILAEYERWLGRQALAARTRSSYRRWVRELVAHLAVGGELKASSRSTGRMTAGRCWVIGAVGWSTVA